MDNLKKYIEQHRQEFDASDPPDLWDQIDHRLGKQATTFHLSWSHKLLAAASVILLIGIGFLMGSLSAKKGAQHPLASSEIEKTESFYKIKINKKKKRLARLTADSMWVEDFQQLEIVLQELKHELANNPETVREEILEAIRQNYQIRMNILDRILDRTKEKTFVNTKPRNYDSPE